MLKSLACMDTLSASAIANDSVVVVSGLPRSGTSMLMRMLALGGIEPLTDNIRQKNSRNPHGYFEWEAIKQRDSYIDWINQATCKTLKVVSRFLPYLPATKNYRVLFLQRGLDAVIRSQKDMAKHFSDASWNDESADKLKDVYRRHLADTLMWVNKRPNMQLHQVHYENIIEAPTQAIKGICDFLNPFHLDTAQMLHAVDPVLNHAGVRLNDSFVEDSKKVFV